ncbi:hypothetical protein COBT_003816, partial [Conglomerata obtusa]
MFNVLHEKISAKTNEGEKKLELIELNSRAGSELSEHSRMNLDAVFTKMIYEISDINKHLDAKVNVSLIARYRDELSTFKTNIDASIADNRLKLINKTKNNTAEIIRLLYKEINEWFNVHYQEYKIIEEFILILGNLEFMKLKKILKKTHDVLKIIINDSIHFSNEIFKSMEKNIQSNNLGSILDIADILISIKGNIESSKLLFKSQFEIYHKKFNSLCKQITLDANDDEICLEFLDIARTDVVLRLNKIYKFIDDEWEQKISYFEHFANVYILMFKMRKTPLLIHIKYPLINSDKLYNDEQLKKKLASMFTSFIGAYENTTKFYKDVFETNNLNEISPLKDLL